MARQFISNFFVACSFCLLVVVAGGSCWWWCCGCATFSMQLVHAPGSGASVNCTCGNETDGMLS